MRKLFSVVSFLVLFVLVFGPPNAGAQVPPPVTLVSPADFGDVPVGPVALKWQRTTGADQYNLLAYLRIGADSILISNWTGVDTTATISGLLNGDRVSWKVRAHNGSGWGTYSAVRRFTVNGVLPISLVSFTGRYTISSQSVILNWTTISETNNYGFFIERKLQGTNTSYDTLGFVPGHGTTLERWDYTFTDISVAPGQWLYRLVQVDLDGTPHPTDPIWIDVLTGVAENSRVTEFALYQNYPNPFNPTTTIAYALPKISEVTLVVYTMLGQEVSRIVAGVQPAGLHAIHFDASNLSSGTYVYRLEAGSMVLMNRMTLLR